MMVIKTTKGVKLYTGYYKTRDICNNCLKVITIDFK